VRCSLEGSRDDRVHVPTTCRATNTGTALHHYAGLNWSLTASAHPTRSPAAAAWSVPAARTRDLRSQLHWAHLRTTNPIESTFATVRPRQRVTKGPGSRAAGIARASSSSSTRKPGGVPSTHPSSSHSSAPARPLPTASWSNETTNNPTTTATNQEAIRKPHEHAIHKSWPLLRALNEHVAPRTFDTASTVPWRPGRVAKGLDQHRSPAHRHQRSRVGYTVSIPGRAESCSTAPRRCSKAVAFSSIALRLKPWLRATLGHWQVAVQTLLTAVLGFVDLEVVGARQQRVDHRLPLQLAVAGGLAFETFGGHDVEHLREAPSRRRSTRSRGCAGDRRCC